MVPSSHRHTEQVLGSEFQVYLLCPNKSAAPLAAMKSTLSQTATGFWFHPLASDPGDMVSEVQWREKTLHEACRFWTAQRSPSLSRNLRGALGPIAGSPVPDIFESMHHGFVGGGIAARPAGDDLARNAPRPFCKPSSRVR